MRNRRILAALAATGVVLSACQSDLGGRTAAGQQALAQGYSFQTHRECDGEVALQLQNLGIAPGAVDAIWYEDQTNQVQGREDFVTGYEAYTRLVDQPGLLVVETTRDCITRQVYTRDGLSLPGVAAF